MLAEMEFLNLYRDQVKTVVYAGAAPGTHITLLSEMFPDVLFVCVDPAPFTVKAAENRIITRQELFTDDLAREMADKYREGLLFVSDIRAVDWERATFQQVEEQVMWDMDAQRRWHEIMKPIASELKFRLPWGAGKTPYPEGVIYYPVWGPITTTEARLVCRGDAPLFQYDNKAYEDEMFYFNTTRRVQLHPHDCGPDMVFGSMYDHCYDCASEIHIIREHLRVTAARFGAQYPFMKWDGEDPELQRRMVVNVSLDMNRVATNRTLLDGNLEPEDRKKKITKRQFIDSKPAYETAAHRLGVSVAESQKGTSGEATSKRKREEEEAEYAGPDAYKAKAMRMMPGYTGGALGANATGISEPIKLSEQVGSRGLGFDAARPYWPSSMVVKSLPVAGAVEDEDDNGMPIDASRQAGGSAPRSQQHQPYQHEHQHQPYQQHRQQHHQQQQPRGDLRDRITQQHQHQQEPKRDPVLSDKWNSWVVCKSNKTGRLYFYHEETKESTYEAPSGSPWW